jgi:hypothetical protein
MKTKILISLLLAALMFGSTNVLLVSADVPGSIDVVPLSIYVTPSGQTVTGPSYRATWKLTFEGEPGQSFCFTVNWGDGMSPYQSCGYHDGEQVTVIHDFLRPGDPLGRKNQTWTGSGVGGPAYAYTYVIKQ